MDKDSAIDVIPDNPMKDDRKRKLSLRTKLAFSSGGLQEATVGAAAITTMIFYNQVLGLSPGLCGIAFMIASIVDGISDPLAAALLVGLPHVLRMAGWFPANDSPLLLWLLFGPMFLGFMIMPVTAIVVDSQLVDVADDHELRTGKRAEGIVFSIRTFAMKATGGLGGMIGGFALEIIGFPQDAQVGQLADKTVNGLLFINGPLYIGIFVLGVIFMLMYRLNEKRHQEILTELEARRGTAIEDEGIEHPAVDSLSPLQRDRDRMTS